jgi:regulator of sirC expression with transglutaminase-like and TPR domain
VSRASRERFAAVVREQPVDLALACLLIATEVTPTLDVRGSLRELDRLAHGVDRRLPPVPELQAALSSFRGSADDYDDLRSSLLPDVLRRRRGLPILLSVVWAEVARRAGIPAYPIALPRHVIVGVGNPHEGPELIDPFHAGRLLTRQEAAALAGRPITDDDIVPADPRDLLLRILTNIRVWAHSSERWRTRLWAVELSLLLPRHPVDLRREHGRLLARAGDFDGAAAEIAAYADVLASVDDEAARAARDEARLVRSRLN